MTGNFIIMSFPRFAGGKFISNCLSLSKFCCPQDQKTAEYLLEYPDDYEYRLNAIMQTLPASRDEMINWIPRYEFGDQQFFGHSVCSWRDGNQAPTTELIDKLLKSNFQLFLNSHGGDILVQNFLKVWPTSIIIKLINHTKFSKISQLLKSADNITIESHAGNYCESKYNLLAGPSWPSWHEFESVGYDIRNLLVDEEISNEILNFYNWRNVDNQVCLFDVDNSIFKRTNFLKAIETLYAQLGFSDFNPELVGKFWQSYMSLHIDNVDIT